MPSSSETLSIPSERRTCPPGLDLLRVPRRATFSLSKKTDKARAANCKPGMLGRLPEAASAGEEHLTRPSWIRPSIPALDSRPPGERPLPRPAELGIMPRRGGHEFGGGRPREARASLLMTMRQPDRLPGPRSLLNEVNLGREAVEVL
jgi:hypothetical protein